MVVDREALLTVALRALRQAHGMESVVGHEGQNNYAKTIVSL